MHELEVELTEDDLRLLHEIAHRRGMTSDDYARHAIRLYLGLESDGSRDVIDRQLP
jgi:hypothetical protein